MIDNLMTGFLVGYGLIALRYLFFGSIFYLIYYKLFRTKLALTKIQSKFPQNQDILRELKYSLLTIVFFSFIGTVTLISPLTEFTQVYFQFNEMPTWYYFLSFPIMLIIHDTYFYWMHRVLHQPKVFKHALLIHHKSTNPSPWASYAFHPIEAVMEAAILPILAFTLPLHISAIAIFFIFSVFYNTYGHSGFEWYPKKFHSHWLGKWINTSVHHNLHHKNFDNSYGLYFTFWDRAMGTLAKGYEETYDEVLERRR